MSPEEAYRKGQQMAQNNPAVLKVEPHQVGGWQNAQNINAAIQAERDKQNNS